MCEPAPPKYRRTGSSPPVPESERWRALSPEEKTRRWAELMESAWRYKPTHVTKKEENNA